MTQHISVRDMAPSLEFTESVDLSWSTVASVRRLALLKASDAFVNLVAKPGYQHVVLGRFSKSMVLLPGARFHLSENHAESQLNDTWAAALRADHAQRAGRSQTRRWFA